MEQLIQQAQQKAKELLKGKPTPGILLKDVPGFQGVYLVYGNDDKVIYVGKSRNLRTRLLGEHISAENDHSTSTFRRKLSRKLDMPPGAAMKEWIVKNCSFIWVKVDDPDITTLVEDLLIAYFRGQPDKANLLNS